jgi:acetyl-CoA carboxylase beta subunit
MNTLNPSYGAPFTAKSGQANPDDVLREIMEENPQATERTTWPLFRTEMLKDQELIEACLRWYHTNARRRLESLMEEKPKAERSVTAEEEKEAKVVKGLAATEKVKAVKKAFILDHVMPNGEALRDCTFRYVAKIGGAFSRIANMGKPNQLVGDVLSNKQADKAMQR